MKRVVLSECRKDLNTYDGDKVLKKWKVELDDELIGEVLKLRTDEGRIHYVSSLFNEKGHYEKDSNELQEVVRGIVVDFLNRDVDYDWDCFKIFEKEYGGS